MRELAQEGYISSLWTVVYRCGRTGDKIMNLLKSGKEGQFCKLNVILTYRKWLDDFAPEETRKAVKPVMKKEIAQVKETCLRI